MSTLVAGSLGAAALITALYVLGRPLRRVVRTMDLVTGTDARTGLEQQLRDSDAWRGRVDQSLEQIRRDVARIEQLDKALRKATALLAVVADRTERING